MGNHKCCISHFQKYAIDAPKKDNYQSVLIVVMKNCDPLVSGPPFAIDKFPVSKNSKLTPSATYTIQYI